MAMGCGSRGVAQMKVQKIDDIPVFKYMYYILESMESDNLSGYLNNIFNTPPNGGVCVSASYRERPRWCLERRRIFCNRDLISLSGICMGNTLSNCNGARARNKTCT